VSLGKEQNVSKIVQLIKGESSLWINKSGFDGGRFEWQDDYFAVSVSESQVEAVKEYIDNQEEHHRKKSFAEEVEEFIKRYGFERLG
jgi:putative transposase